MSWRLSLFTSPGQKQRVAARRAQRGAFSPLLFGMLMGLVIFSGLSAQWARRDLVRYQKLQTERAQAQASDVAKALDFAILTEDKQSYSEEYSLKRALSYSNSSAKTRGKQDFMVNVQSGEAEGGRFGQTRATVAIAATDDTLLRAKVYRAGSGKELQEIDSSHPVAVYDTAAARDRQVRDSAALMEALGEKIYAFVAANKKFPTPDEYETLAHRFPSADVWGQPFTYTPGDDTFSGKLSFTTPWGYTQTIKLSLKDETVEDKN